MQWLSQGTVGLEREDARQGSGKNWDQWAIWSLPLLYAAIQLALIRGNLHCELGQLLS